MSDDIRDNGEEVFDEPVGGEGEDSADEPTAGPSEPEADAGRASGPPPAEPRSSDLKAGSGGMARRDVLKALATVPVFGALGYTALRRRGLDTDERRRLLNELGIEDEGAAVFSELETRTYPDVIRVGIIGYGGEGESLVRSLGFAHPDWFDELREAKLEDPYDTRLEEWLEQENLNVELTAVCDLFDVRSDRAVTASTQPIRPGGDTRQLAPAKRYRHYEELLAAPDVDAVIIATPDHWHSRITVAAAEMGKAAANKVPFSLERFFRWRCWYDYGTGLSGDLLSHEYDAINQVLDLGIPNSATASGGIYFFKDGRDVPDVWQAVFEYPDRDLTLVYSATLANGYQRGIRMMGHDATMEVGEHLSVTADGLSTRYAEMLEEEILRTDRPMLTYQSGYKGVDAVTTPTQEYFASRGLLFTYRGGRRVSTYYLHLREWLNCIRDGGTPSCNIDRGIEEAITCHMATKSYLEGRRVYWDPIERKIV
ncbi:MAG: Gfo/Idh/MocA family oxidoreductase [Gemmatimonadales bacterium]